MSEPVEGHLTARDGAELFYRELGTGRPLVLLHGAFAGSELWFDHGDAQLLAERGHRVLAPDFRAHGRSSRPSHAEGYPRDVLTEDALDLVGALDLEDYDLAGYSLGGRIVVRMLIRGALPRRAVVGGQGLDQITADREHDPTHRVVLDALVDDRPLREGSTEAAMARWLTGTGADPLALRRVLDSLVPSAPAAIAELTTPALVVAGRDDPRSSSAPELARLLHARYEQVPGDHATAFTDGHVTRVLDDFLDVDQRPPAREVRR